VQKWDEDLWEEKALWAFHQIHILGEEYLTISKLFNSSLLADTRCFLQEHLDYSAE